MPEIWSRKSLVSICRSNLVSAPQTISSNHTRTNGVLADDWWVSSLAVELTNQRVSLSIQPTLRPNSTTDCHGSVFHANPFIDSSPSTADHCNALHGSTGTQVIGYSHVCKAR